MNKQFTQEELAIRTEAIKDIFDLSNDIRLMETYLLNPTDDYIVGLPDADGPWIARREDGKIGPVVNGEHWEIPVSLCLPLDAACMTEQEANIWCFHFMGNTDAVIRLEDATRNKVAIYTRLVELLKSIWDIK